MAVNLSPPGRGVGAVRALYQRYVDAVCARPRRAALILVAACLPALALTVTFFGHIDAGLQNLLRPSAPSVKALTTLHEVVGGRAHLTVIAQSPDRDANERFVAALTAKLEAEHLPEVRSIQGDVRAERAWLIAHAPVLMPRGKFDALMTRLDAALAEAKRDFKPLDLGLGDDDAQQAPIDWSRIEAELDQALAAADRFPRGYLETADGHTVVAILWLKGSEVDIEPSTRLMDDVGHVASALGPRFPGVRVAYNGEVPNLVEEHAAILADLSASSLFVVVLVGACIALYFRSLRAVLTVVLTLVPGLLFAFALGRLTVGGLNSNTAFLGTIIAGNGINYPLLALAYYRSQPADLPMNRALGLSARQAFPGTLGAAITAAAAYGGLAVSDFRGFSQFGWLGSSGMITVWILTFAAAPVLVANLRPPRRAQASTAVQTAISRFFSRGRAAGAAAGVFVCLALGWAGWGVACAERSGLYETNLQVMRNRTSLARGSASWDAKMNELFGVWLNPLVAFARDPSQREAAATALRQVFAAHDPAGIESVETIEKYAPPLADQRARLARLQAAGHDVRRVPHDQIPAKLRPYLQAWFDPANLKPIVPADVPAPLRQSFEERSGRVDRLVLLFPSIQVNYNDGRNLEHFDAVVKQAQMPPGVVLGGGFLFMAEILRLVRTQAFGVVGVVCGVVGMLLVALFWRRPMRAVVSLCSMVVVAFCSMAVMLALGIKVNLLNFAALPITIGVGADYVVNLFGAMSTLGVGARTACAKMGGAILLCSLTTTVGYLSLVLAQSGALRSFGWAAVLGEVMAVVTVLLVLPVVMGDVAERAAPERPASKEEVLS